MEYKTWPRTAQMTGQNKTYDMAERMAEARKGDKLKDRTEDTNENKAG